MISIFIVCLFVAMVIMFTVLPAIGLALTGSILWALALLLPLLLALCMPAYTVLYMIYHRLKYGSFPAAKWWWTVLAIWIVAILCLGGGTAKVTHDNPDLMSFGKTVWQQIDEADDEWDDDDAPCGATVQRDVEAFNAIDASGAVAVKLSADSSHTGLRIEEGCEDDIQTEVRDSILYISTKGSQHRRPEIHLSAPDVRSIHLSGASELECEDSFPSLKVVCDGASEAEAQADTLWMQASGASKITYSGNPVVLHNMSVGASTIRNK